MQQLQPPSGSANPSIADGDASDQVLTFITAGEEYGVDILRVQEIRGWDRATAIPNAPPSVKGVINLRGSIVPIIDLRMRFNLPVAEYGKSTVVIVLRVEEQSKTRIMGIVVDAVSDVYNLRRDEISPPPELGASNLEFLKGIATADEKMIFLLDVDLLLSSNELKALAPDCPSGH